MFETAAGDDRPDDLDRLARPANGPVEANTMPALHDLRSAGTDPEHERPSDSARSDCADMASIAGVRAPSCTIPVASRIREVQAAM
jgi:hypothetical protein